MPDTKTTFRQFTFGFDGDRPYVQAFDWTAPASETCPHCGTELDNGGGTLVESGPCVYVELPAGGKGPWCLTVGKDEVPEWRSFMPLNGGAWLSRDRKRFTSWPE